MKKKAGLFKSIDWITVFIYLVLLGMGWMSVCGATYDFDQAGNFFISGSTFDAMISDHSYMPEGFEDGYKGKYGISCSIFTNYRIDKMKAGSN